MIPLPNYDDQTFQGIMEMVRRRIPVIYPQWTDLNEHDPGITILELFAWLKEMQQYHLNRITTRSYESMLKLLGITVGEATAAHTRVAFPGISTGGTLPQGMRFKTQGNIVFESQDSVSLNSFKIESIYVSDGTVFGDVKDMILEPGIYCYAFGQKPTEGSSALYIGFDQLDIGREVPLYFQIDDSYPIPRNPFQMNSQRPRDVLWEYGVLGEAGLEFRAIEAVQDKTFGFSQSGEVLIKIAQEAFFASMGEGLPACCWIRARLIRKGCEENPRLVNIYKDTALVAQKETHCEMNDLVLTEVVSEVICELPRWLALKGKHFVFVRDDLGWQSHQSFMITSHEEKEGIEVLKLTGLPRKLALDGTENIRILCYEAEFEGSMVLSGSDGLPCQRFSFRCEDTVLKEQLAVMVYEETEEGPKRWTDWKYVSKLSGTGPYDRCFTYDSITGELVFGDNEHGAVPLAGESNILITSCVTTKGLGGNIGVQDFAVLEYKDICLKPVNLYPAFGGRDAESIDAAIERFKRSLKQTVRAVTVADYEILAAATPGLRVMGVRAIPFYDPDSKVAGDKQTPATVTIVALPYSKEPFPQPDSHFLGAIRNYLENFRLITTKVKVIGPAYVKISVYVEAIVDSRRVNIEENVKVAIEAYFEGLRKGIAGGKPAFGQPVREAVLAMKIGEIAGVTHVTKLTLGVRNGDSYRDKYGNIVIPPQGLPYLGDLQIRTLI